MVVLAVTCSANIHQLARYLCLGFNSLFYSAIVLYDIITAENLDLAVFSVRAFEYCVSKYPSNANCLTVCTLLIKCFLCKVNFLHGLLINVVGSARLR